MKKLITILLLAISGFASAQQYQLNYADIRIGNLNSKTAFRGNNILMPYIPLGLSTDSVLTIAGGQIKKVPRSQFSGGGSSYTFNNGLTNTAGVVGLGGDFEMFSNSLENQLSLSQYGFYSANTGVNGATELYNGITGNGANPIINLNVGNTNGTLQLSMLPVDEGGFGKGIYLIDDVFKKGLLLAKDYSKSFTLADSNYLAPKAYVDRVASSGSSVTASDGLTKTGSNIKLGGDYTDLIVVGNVSDNKAKIILSDSTIAVLGIGGIGSPIGASAGVSQFVDGVGASLTYGVNGLNGKSIRVSSSGIIVRDGIDNRGMEAGGNYEANYTSKSYTSKRYVDSVANASGGGFPITASNGLNISGSTIKLGGTIDGSGVSINYPDTNNAFTLYQDTSTNEGFSKIGDQFASLTATRVGFSTAGNNTIRLAAVNNNTASVGINISVPMLAANANLSKITVHDDFGFSGGLGDDGDYSAYKTQYNYVTKKMLEDATSGAVTSFNSRTGAVTPQLSDYSSFYEPIISPKNTAFNVNFGTASGTVAQGNDSRINNGQTAFGWGNHATAGYYSPSNSPVTNSLSASTVLAPSVTLVNTALSAKENTITATTSADYYRGDKTFQPLNKSAVGLSNVDNTSDANKPVSTAQQTALDGKQGTLVSGTNIKTINGNSVLGSGDLVVSGGAVSSLTTTGTSGAATLSSGVLNIPNYVATDFYPLETEFEGQGLSSDKFRLKAAGVTVAKGGTGVATLTGIVKGNGTSPFTAAVAGDFPTLNQNTTGSAASLTTSRNLWGVGFNGTANVTAKPTFTAGTTASASINIAQGVAPTTPANGDIWNTSTVQQHRIGGVTKTVAYTSDITTPTLQQVTNVGATSTNAIRFTGNSGLTGQAALELYYDTGVATPTASITAYDRNAAVFKPLTIQSLQTNFTNGNVLIGTTTDIGAKLYVNGVINTTSNISAAGNVNAGQLGAATNITAGSDIEVLDATKGIILKSPNGTRWRITISNTGVLTTTSL